MKARVICTTILLGVLLLHESGEADCGMEALGRCTAVLHTTAIMEYDLSDTPASMIRRAPFDVCGSVFWKGRYHFLYLLAKYDMRKLNTLITKGLYTRVAPDGEYRWIMASSANLAEWTYCFVDGPAITETVCSGNIFLNKDGVPTMSFFQPGVGVSIAVSQDDELLKWKSLGPVLPVSADTAPKNVQEQWHPFVWVQGDKYRCILTNESGGLSMNRVAPWESSDLVKWNLSGSLTDALKATALSEKPSHAYCDFFSLADKWVFAQMGSGTSTPYNYVRYAEGTHLADSGQSLPFIFPKSRCFAPQSLQDSKGRRIVWSWVQLPISWISYFAMTIPSVVSLDAEGMVNIEPVPETEIALMATDALKLENIVVPSESEVLLEQITEECSKIVAEIDPGDAKAVGLKICCPNEGGDKGIYIGYNSVKKILSVDSSNSASDYTRLPKAESATWNEMRGGVTETPFSLSTGEPLRLKVFIDGPLLEVYANGRQYLLCLIPPQKGSAWRIKVCSQGTGMTVRSLSAQYGNKAILDKLNEGINALAQPKK